MKKIINLFLLILMFSFIMVGCSNKDQPIKQDINTINGCPEFYDIKWGMSSDELSNAIPLEHRVQNGFDEFVVNGELPGIVLIDEDFYLYGRKSPYVYLTLDGTEVNRIFISFHSSEYPLSDIVDLYTEIYGEPTESDSNTWIGKKTTIRITEEDNGKEIVVRYSITSVEESGGNIADTENISSNTEAVDTSQSNTSNTEAVDTSQSNTSNNNEDKKLEYQIKITEYEVKVLELKREKQDALYDIDDQIADLEDARDREYAQAIANSGGYVSSVAKTIKERYNSQISSLEQRKATIKQSYDKQIASYQKTIEEYKKLLANLK